MLALQDLLRIIVTCTVLFAPKLRQLAAAIACCELYVQGKLKIVLSHGMHLNISGGNKSSKSQSIPIIHKVLQGFGYCNV